ncbi:cystatin-9-like [Phodopus roborovskii]|uniref:Cstdc2 protein n=1 Tax=Phodopus roborovskii TaxID=109678 RepID=A0AAU9Z7F4_PHORO|nr:cystatin-9-like [Phodopus roborovskii]CAH6787743.1 Cstdc2 [Phodopus roborovskii]
MALPWAVLLVLLGFQAQGAQTWCSEKDEPYIDKPVSDPDIVKFAVNTFNNQSKDEYAYRSIHIMSFSKVQEKLSATFFMKLRLRRTICKKFEDSLDTCPFQDSPELDNMYICSFTISTPRSKQFNMLKITCPTGPP